MSAIFAGIMIGIAALGYLRNPIVGMFTFVVGLAGVVHYKSMLYTGFVGFVDSVGEIVGVLPVVIFGNIIGTAIVSLCTHIAMPSVMESAQHVIESRIACGPFACFYLSIFCGVLMSLAVSAARRGVEFGRWVPLCIAVPAFILCGFPHSIADSFYYMSLPSEYFYSHLTDIITIWACCVLGNGVGCNLYRVLLRSN